MLGRNALKPPQADPDPPPKKKRIQKVDPYRGVGGSYNSSKGSIRV